MNDKLYAQFENTIVKGKKIARRKLYFMSLIFLTFSVIFCYSKYKFNNILINIIALEITALLPIIVLVMFKNELEFKSIPEYIILEFIKNLEFIDPKKKVGMCKYGLVIMNSFSFKIVLFNNIAENKCTVSRNPIVNTIYIKYKFKTNIKLKLLNYSWFERTNLDEIIHSELKKHTPVFNDSQPYLDMPKAKKRYYDYNDDKAILN